EQDLARRRIHDLARAARREHEEQRDALHGAPARTQRRPSSELAPPPARRRATMGPTTLSSQLPPRLAGTVDGASHAGSNIGGRAQPAPARCPPAPRSSPA